MRKPTTKINNRPISFVQLGSSTQGDYSPISADGKDRMTGRFTDSRQVDYERVRSGQIVGYPRLMREVKQAARQTRLARRTAFREGKGV